MTVAELKKKKAGLVEEAEAILEAEETRNLTDEEQAEADTLLGKIEDLNKSIERREKVETERRSLEQSSPRISAPNVQTRQLEDSELRSWLNGESGRDFEFQLRAQSFSAGAGAELVPADGDFAGKVEVAKKKFGGIVNHASELRTTDGTTIPYPLSDDTNNKATIVDPNAERTDSDIAFGSKDLGAYTLNAGPIRVPFELLEDSAVNLENFVAERLGERLARGLSSYFAVGTGTSEPEGISIGAVDGPTQTTLGDVTYDELLDLEASIDPAYWDNSRFLLNSQTLRVIKGITNSNGDPIFVPGNISKGSPSTLLGYPITMVQELDALDVVDGKAIIFGDISKYVARLVRGIRLQRLSERYAEYGQVGFLAHIRADGALMDAGTNPVKAFVNAAA